MTNRNPESEPSQSATSVNSQEHLEIDVPFVGETSAPTINIPTKSPNRTCNFYLREIERQGRMTDVESFLNSALHRDYHEPASPAELSTFATEYADLIDPCLNPEDKAALKRYSGYNYRLINQVSRGQWDYDILGQQTPEKVANAEEDIANIRHAIQAAPTPGIDLITHRGTNLDSFSSYGINSLNDLANLKNNLFLETGFTSTSLSSNHSFINRNDFDDPLRKSCNIAIEYHIPAEANEVIGLLSSDTAYDNQYEILIDRDSLSYISSVEISPDQTSAKLQMTLIPRQIYDPATH